MAQWAKKHTESCNTKSQFKAGQTFSTSPVFSTEKPSHKVKMAKKYCKKFQTKHSHVSVQTKFEHKIYTETKLNWIYKMSIK